MLQRLASLRLTLFGMLLLALGAALSYDNPVTTPVWMLVVPLFILAVNLLFAIIFNPRINRRVGLLVFHIGLLLIVVLAGIGRLTHLEANIELVEGVAFDAADMINVRRGLFHGDGLDEIHFVQGPYTVEYRAGMVRGLTHSRVMVDGLNQNQKWQEHIIGDDRPLLIAGYRFYTTFNKGFAPILTWQADATTKSMPAPITGAINMPSYPLFDFKQSNSWTPPGGEEIRFWLQLETGLTAKAAWTLDVRQAQGQLVVKDGKQRKVLQEGDSIALAGGTMTYERLSSWMGYKVYYDPTLLWLLLAAFTSVLGLAVHYWQKFASEPLILSKAENQEKVMK